MSITTAREATELLREYKNDEISFVLEQIEEACKQGENYVNISGGVHSKTITALKSRGFEVVYGSNTTQVIWPIY